MGWYVQVPEHELANFVEDWMTERCRVANAYLARFAKAIGGGSQLLSLRH